MEKFMFIFHGGQMPEDQQSPEALQESMGKWFAWIEKLNAAGRYDSGEPLLPGGKHITAVNAVTDGPYAEGREVVGGYFVVKAENMDEAVEIAKDYPDFEYGGTVQVRQVMKVDM